MAWSVQPWRRRTTRTPRFAAIISARRTRQPGMKYAHAITISRRAPRIPATYMASMSRRWRTLSRCTKAATLDPRGRGTEELHRHPGGAQRFHERVRQAARPERIQHHPHAHAAAGRPNQRLGNAAPDRVVDVDVGFEANFFARAIDRRLD